MTPGLDEPLKAVVPLSVLVIGGGIGGFAAAHILGRYGHKVTVIEQAPEIGEVGAGIQVSPNLSRIVERHGLSGYLKPNAVEMRTLRIRRWKDGSTLAEAPAMPQIERIHGAPQYVVFRPELLDTFMKGALEQKENVTLHLNSMVDKVEWDESGRAQVTLTNGKAYSADVVVGADGVRSKTRAELYKYWGLGEDESKSTGEEAYRVVIPAETLLASDELRYLIEEPTGMRDIGPGAHVVMYPIKGKTLYNIVTAHPESKDADEGSWTSVGSKTHLLELYKGWHPELIKLLEYAPPGECLRWKLRTHTVMDKWTEGNFALLGDAVHPMLPHVAQGAAQAVEDAAVLAVVLSKVPDKQSIRQALLAYQVARKPRADWVQAAAENASIDLHLPDGEEQRKRDVMFRNVAKGGPNPDKWCVIY